jgi:hypothetical protein
MSHLLLVAGSLLAGVSATCGEFDPDTVVRFSDVPVVLPGPKTADGLPPAEVVDVPPLPLPPAPRKAAEPPAGPSSYSGPGVPGYKLVLSGELTDDLVIGPEHSPALVRGVLIVPAERTLTLKAGATLHLKADPQAQPPDKRGVPDPTKAGALWVCGRVLADGLGGKPVEIAAPVPDEGGLYWYGQGLSELRGVKLNRLGITQGAGAVQWLGCELSDTKHYALASGAAFLIHCTLRRAGGVFAAYESGAWALLVKDCAFESCREGLVFRTDPGPENLVVEHNSFVGTRGAILRALSSGAGKGGGRKNAPELLIGENWYGTNVPDRVDAAIVDRRAEPSIRLWLNTRPPAEKPYAQVGANVPVSALARALKDAEKDRLRMLAALAKKSDTTSKQATR